MAPSPFWGPVVYLLKSVPITRKARIHTFLWRATLNHWLTDARSVWILQFLCVLIGATPRWGLNHYNKTWGSNSVCKVPADCWYGWSRTMLEFLRSTLFLMPGGQSQVCILETWFGLLAWLGHLPGLDSLLISPENTSNKSLYRWRCKQNQLHLYPGFKFLAVCNLWPASHP